MHAAVVVPADEFVQYQFASYSRRIATLSVDPA